MISVELLLLLNLTKAQTLVAKRFDALNVHGLSFSDFMILYVLSTAEEQRMRRIDLAAQIGLTASGVTRLLNPLEKIGWVGRESNARDARVSYVAITEAGRQVLADAMVTAQRVTAELLSTQKQKPLQVMAQLLADLGGDIK